MSMGGSSHHSQELTPLISRTGDESSPPLVGTPACDPDQMTVISQRPPSPHLSRPSQPDPLGATLAGERLGHFELREYAGGGGMGAVFRGLDTVLNREVAIKVLSREQAADDDTRRRFRNEAESAARLDHENIARVYYAGEDRGLHYIVFEFIDGENLRDLVDRKGPLALPEAISYAIQVAEALAHASSRDVVHRDIKPSNVIVTAEGRAKLVDMGLARLHQVPAHGEDLTASGVTLGTFDYISPEQARDPRSADVRSDIYSLGCSLYYMLTARPPFPEGTVLQKLLQHNSDAPPDPREFDPELPDEVAALVRKMLAKDPRHRHQNASELIGELLALAEDVGCLLPGSRTVTWVARTGPPVASWQRHIPWLVPVAALVTIVLVLDQWWPAGDGPRVTERHGAGASLPTGDVPDAPAAVPGETQVIGENPIVGQSAGDRSATTEPTLPAEPHVAGAESPQTVPSGQAPTPRRQTDALDAQLGQPAQTPVERPAPGGTNSATMPLAGDAEMGDGGEPMEDLTEDDRNAPGRAATDTAATTDRVSAPTDDRQAPADAPAPLINAHSTSAELPPGLLVVSESGQGPGYYRSLSAACAEAKSGNTIELRYNGHRDETPITLANLDLTIRAGIGFRPVMAFRPSDSDPVKPRSMLTVAGGSLKLEGVSLELDLPRAVPAERWSLFEAQLARRVQLDRCWLTIRNAYGRQGAFHQTVAFFNVRAAPGVDSMMMPKGMMPIDPVEIRLNDSIARGEAALLRIADLQPVRLLWHNGLLATTQRLLEVIGGATAPMAGGAVHVELENLTAAIRGGLCLVQNSRDAPLLLPIEIRCTESILLGGGESVLVEQTGTETQAVFQQGLNWHGLRNVYQGFGTFWKVSDLGSSNPPLAMSYSNWREYWTEQEVPPQLPPPGWNELPSPERPAHTHTAADYALAVRRDSATGQMYQPGLKIAELPADAFGR